MDVREALDRLLDIEASLVAIGAQRDALRSELLTEALHRWDNEGAAPTWRVPQVGSVHLAGAGRMALRIDDSDAYVAWAANDHPSAVRLQVDVEARLVPAAVIVALQEAAVPIRCTVHPRVIETLVPGPDGQACTEDGEIVPGIRAAPKKPYLSVRLDAAAKQAAMTRHG